MGFTSVDRDLTFDGLTYKANSGIVPSATEANNKLEVGNLSINSYLDSDNFTEEDVIAGLYDLAKIKVFLVNYLDLPVSLTIAPYNYVLLLDGVVGKTSTTDKGFLFEVRSLTQYLNQKTSNVTSPFCRYEFGDSNCGVDLATYTQSFEVISVGSNQIIGVADSLDSEVYQYGVITFSSGAADGFSFRVSSNNSSSFTLFEPCPFLIEAGDTFNAVAGCDKSRDDCKSFSNIVNFGGEPDVPGVDEYLAGYQE